ncbi:MAG: peptide ABC transporter substrate-binding protein [Thermomicrobiales bacterium]
MDSTPQREPRELMRQLLAGQLDRRGFIRRALALGFSASAVAGFLAACGGTPTATTTTSSSSSSAAATSSSSSSTSAAATSSAAGAASSSSTTKAATTSAASSAASSSAATSSAASSSASSSAAASASPTGGGASLGVKTDKPLGAGGGLGPGPKKRGGGGTVKLLWWQAPTIANPHQAQGTKDFDLSRITYEPLASFGPDDKLVPFLAAEIPSVDNGGVAKDGKSVTWKLKSGIKWSDGQPFTAKDVIFTWKYTTDKDTAAVTQGVYKGIANVEAPDDNTVKITFQEVTPGWYSVFVGTNGMILPEHVFKDQMGTNTKNSPANLKPVGTGPYRLTDFKPGDTATFEINPNWRDANGPFFDSVEMKGGGDATSAARAVLQTGDYNVAWNLQIEPAIINQMQQSGGKGKLELTPNWGIERIAVNFSDPNKEVNGQRSEKNTPHPFQSDPKVREAYTYLCDRKTVAETLYGPAGQPTANMLTNPKPLASPNTKWSFDIDKAKQILDDAGYKLSGQYRAKGGVQLKVLFQTSTNTVRQKHQQIVKDAFEKAGIQMELKSIDAGVYFSSDAGNPDTLSHFYADLEMYTNSNDSPDPWNYFESWTTDEIAQKENSWNLSNPNRWSNKEYDDTVKAAKTELDSAKRTQQFIHLNDLLVNDVAVIPQVDRLGPQAFSKEINGANVTAWDLTTWNIANWVK